MAISGTVGTITVSASGGGSAAASGGVGGQVVLVYGEQPEYQIELQTPEGKRIDFLTRVGGFEYTKSLMGDGDFSIALNPQFDFGIIREDLRVVFSRRPAGGSLSIDFVGFVRDWDINQVQGGYAYKIMGPSAKWLLGGRVVAYPAGSAQAEMTDEADNILLEIIRDNMGADATAARAYNATYFTVQANASAGTPLAKGFSYQNVQDTIRAISEYTRQLTPAIYYDVVPNGDGFQVRIGVGQLGTDKSESVIFGPEYGNFQGGKLEYRSRDEVNFVYALGQGEGAARKVQTLEDTTRTGKSIWARRESAVEDTSATSNAALLSKAYQELIANRPHERVSGVIQSTSDTQYQRDWNMGDKVGLTFAGAQYVVLVPAVTVHMSGTGQETITSQIEIIEASVLE